MQHGSDKAQFHGTQDLTLTGGWVPLTWAPSRAPGQCGFCLHPILTVWQRTAINDCLLHSTRRAMSRC